MNYFPLNKTLPGRFADVRQQVVRGGRAMAVVAGGMALSLTLATHAFAAGGTAPTAPVGGLGDQMNLLSSEGTSTVATGFGFLCYAAAVVCFFGGAWAAWQSRQPQNRESGHAMRAVAGLVLCGLFATAGVWINKSAISATGANATINDSVGMVQFGTG